MFTFVLFLGTNAGKAQTALPYEINFADSQEGWTAVDNSPTPGTTWTYKPRRAYIQGTYYGSIVLSMDYVYHAMTIMFHQNSHLNQENHILRNSIYVIRPTETKIPYHLNKARQIAI